MRGLPGSGKSTRAQELCDEYTKKGFSVAICSTDSQFLDKNGVYKFDPSKLGVNHHRNWLIADDAMSIAIDVIIIDNTNIKKRDFKKYIDSAKMWGYSIKEEIIGKFDDESVKIYHGRNQHNVPIEAISRMAKSFEA
jgi:predicted kinase